ncbi:MAG: TIGR03118 family protein [Gammaproteobacteria bacterium]|jgi:uncharacterized protein (TIGR03118 family)
MNLIQLYRNTGMPLMLVVLAAVSTGCPSSSNAAYNETKLISDVPGLAKHTDPNLVNPWGIAMSSQGPFWVADDGSGVITLYNGQGKSISQLPEVTVPSLSAKKAVTPVTGQVYNWDTNAFNGDTFIVAAENGTISGWHTGATAAVRVDNSTKGAVYTGLAIGSHKGADYLYAANFHAGTIDVFDSHYHKASWETNAFADPHLSASSGFAPYNIESIGGKLYVTYARQNADKTDSVAGRGNGYVDVYDMDGAFVKRLISKGTLNSPWGLALAPSDFGKFSGDLLVGNFGNGHINAFDLTTGAFRGTVTGTNGAPLAISGLWGLTAGNGHMGGNTDTVYFAAGIAGAGKVEDHGLFGALTPTSQAVSSKPTVAPTREDSYY